MNPETAIQNRIRKAVTKVSQGLAFVLRNNTGLFLTFAGDKVHAGLGKGTSDLIGIASRVIQPEDVGKRVGVFLAIEVKTPKGSASQVQRDFIARIRDLGGIGEIVRDPAEVESVLAQPLGTLPKRKD